MNSRGRLPLRLLTRNLTHTGAMSNNISQADRSPAAAGAAAEDAVQAALAAVRGLKGWIISDGKAGHDVQSRGVFEALGLDYQMKRVDPRGLWRVLSPWGPVSPAERIGTPASQFHPPWPDFAIAVGRLTTPYIRALKRRAGRHAYTIILQDPKVGTGAADLYWVPEHDALRGSNVITTLTSPHGFTSRRIAELRRTMPAEIAALPAPRVAVMLGGPNGDYRYTPAVLARLVSALRALAGLGAGLMITPSRRTPAEIAASVRDATDGLRRLVWSGEGDNPYPHFLAHADVLVVTADSVNMVGEACATGKSVYVLQPEGGSAKFGRYHAALRKHGATRPLPERLERLETWSYTPLNTAETIAAEIARRWLERRQMLGPGGCGGSSQ
jgi:mitochondrial fission protein ELM1